jgi:hypothetical protein
MIHSNSLIAFSLQIMLMQIIMTRILCFFHHIDLSCLCHYSMLRPLGRTYVRTMTCTPLSLTMPTSYNGRWIKQSQHAQHNCSCCHQQPIRWLTAKSKTSIGKDPYQDRTTSVIIPPDATTDDEPKAVPVNLTTRQEVHGRRIVKELGMSIFPSFALDAPLLLTNITNRCCGSFVLSSQEHFGRYLHNSIWW